MSNTPPRAARLSPATEPEAVEKERSNPKPEDKSDSKVIEIDDELFNKLTMEISNMLCTDLKYDKTIELFMAIIKTAQGQKIAADLKNKENSELKYTANLESSDANVAAKILASIYPRATPEELGARERLAGLANGELGAVTGPYSPYILYHYLRIIGELLEERRKKEKKEKEEKVARRRIAVTTARDEIVKDREAEAPRKAALSKAKEMIEKVKVAIEKAIEGAITLNDGVSKDKDIQFITDNDLDNVAKYINLLNVVRSIAATGKPDANIISYLNSLADINLFDDEDNFTSAPLSKDFLSSGVTALDGKTSASGRFFVLTTKLYDALPSKLVTTVTKFGEVEKKYVENIAEAYKLALYIGPELKPPTGKVRVKDVFNTMLYTDNVISELNGKKEVQKAINEAALVDADGAPSAPPSEPERPADDNSNPVLNFNDKLAKLPSSGVIDEYFNVVKDLNAKEFHKLASGLLKVRNENAHTMLKEQFELITRVKDTKTLAQLKEDAEEYPKKSQKLTPAQLEFVGPVAERDAYDAVRNIIAALNDAKIAAGLIMSKHDELEKDGAAVGGRKRKTRSKKKRSLVRRR